MTHDGSGWYSLHMAIKILHGDPGHQGTPADCEACHTELFEPSAQQDPETEAYQSTLAYKVLHGDNAAYAYSLGRTLALLDTMTPADIDYSKAVARGIDRGLKS